jgi:hypothetical protein
LTGYSPERVQWALSRLTSLVRDGDAQAIRRFFERLSAGTPFRGWGLRSRPTQNKMTEQSETTEAPLSLFRCFLFGEGPLRGVEVYEVPGHHDTIVHEPRIRNLASQLSRRRQKAQLEEAILGSASGRQIS